MFKYISGRFFALVSIALIMCACETRRTSNLSYQSVPHKDLPFFENDAVIEAVPALKRSCGVMLRQGEKTYPIPHNSNLSGKQKDWHPFCMAVMNEKSTRSNHWKVLFQKHLTAYKVSFDNNNEGQFTGYYEPLLHGSKRKHGRYKTPLYRYPNNNSTNVKFSRADIVRGVLKGKKLELVWVDDAVDAFFVQIQGSGRVKLDNGKMLRIGYAGTNKHPYHPIGKTLLERGDLQKGNVSMQSIRHWLKTHPKHAEEVMSTNESYVFFRELLNDDGPIGSQGVALTPKRSLAVDPAYIGLGTPLWVDIEHPVDGNKRLSHFMVAQDTGGAIKGGLRADYFWGFGKEATFHAGKMNSKGHLFVLLPKS
jgi:membrane-bound lytic murein transglycosylase A